MNTNFLNNILSKYTEKRNLALLKTNSEKEKVFQIEEYAALDKQERLLIMQIGKCKFEEKNCSMLENQLKMVQNEKLEVLKKHSINPSSLLPKFECEKCEDTGFVNGETCSCLKQEYNNHIMKQSNINIEEIPYLDEYCLNCFEEEEKPNVSLIVENLKKFVSNLKTAKTKNIVLTGGTGVGKTYLAKSLAKEVLKYNHTVLFLSSFVLNNNFLKIHTNSEINKHLLLENLIDVDLLIIDDLGTEPMLKNVTKEYLLLLINERLNKNKSTLITTNLLPNNILDKYGERIYSRLNNKANCALFNLKGKDLRIL